MSARKRNAGSVAPLSMASHEDRDSCSYFAPCLVPFCLRNTEHRILVYSTISTKSFFCVPPFSKCNSEQEFDHWQRSSTSFSYFLIFFESKYNPPLVYDLQKSITFYFPLPNPHTSLCTPLSRLYSCHICRSCLVMFLYVCTQVPTYILMYVCMCMYIYIYTYIYVDIDMYTCIYIHVCRYACVCKCVCKCVCV